MELWSKWCRAKGMLAASVLTAFFMTFAYGHDAQADGLFDKGAKSGPSVVLAEVDCYGYRNLKADFYDTCWEQMAEVVGTADKFNGSYVERTNPDEAALERIHMDAIARGPLFERENANPALVHYGDSIYGRDYFWDEKKLAERKQRKGQAYPLGQNVMGSLQQLGTKYNADYFLFCNLRDVDTELNKSVLNSSVASEAERAKKIKVEMDFYLVDVKTGKVYEGRNVTNKSSNIRNVLIGRFGKGASVQQLLQVMFEQQGKKMIEDINKNGFKALAQ